jgi:hypothetical protein
MTVSQITAGAGFTPARMDDPIRVRQVKPMSMKRFMIQIQSGWKEP